MKVVRKIPFLFSWSIFCALTLLPAWALVLWVLPYLHDLYIRGLYPQLTPNIIFVSFISALVIISFFTFAFSISKIALPIYKTGKIYNYEPARLKFRDCLSKWFLYLALFVAFCIPMLITGLLPIKIEEPIFIAWEFLASFLAYRVVGYSWLDEVILSRRQNSKDQAISG